MFLLVSAATLSDVRKLWLSLLRLGLMPNMEELISRISRKKAGGPADEVWISKLDLTRSITIFERAMNLWLFAVPGRNFTEYYCFLTRRERLKSALYLRLKKAQSFFNLVKRGILATF